MEALDFHGDLDGARERINTWVAEQTARGIENLLAPGTIQARSRLVLVNAIRFVGKWLAPFEKHLTHHSAFWVNGNEMRMVPTMRRFGECRVGSVRGGEIIELPYAGRRTAMYVAVPDERDGLAKLEQSFNFAKWPRGLLTVNVDLRLPRFACAPPTVDVKPLLEALGMRLAFDESRADFTDIADPPDPIDRLSISALFHKAFVRADEEGTVAAAATAGVVRIGSVRLTQPRPFVVDRPFLFFITDLRSGLLLFVGRIVDPSSTAA